MSNRIELGVVLLAGGGVFVDAAVRQAQEEALHAAEAALEKEEQQRQALLANEARTKPNPPEKPNPTAVRVWRLGGLAGGFFR
jgi:hypothetical protein